MGLFHTNPLSKYNPKYLKNFSHRKKVKKSYTLYEAQILAPQYLKQVEDCTNIVNTTINPNVYFMRYDLMVSCLVELSKMEKVIKFTGKKPSAYLNEVLSTREAQLNFFVNRIYDKTLNKVRSLKTDRSKLNHISTFIVTMEDIECELPESVKLNVQNMISELKKNTNLKF